MDELDCIGMREGAVEIERSLNEQGWDGDPVFGWLVREGEPMGEDLWAVNIGVLEFPANLQLRDENPAVAMHLILNDLLAAGRPDLMCYHPALKGFVGMIFAHEGWAKAEDNPALGKRECRFVLAMGRDGSLVTVMRIRGVDEVSVTEKAAEDLLECLDFRIPNGLAKCMILMGMAVPDAVPAYRFLKDHWEKLP